MHGCEPWDETFRLFLFVELEGGTGESEERCGFGSVAPPLGSVLEVVVMRFAHGWTDVSVIIKASKNRSMY